MSINPFVRQLGAQPGVQLNPLLESLSAVDADAADQVFAAVARLTRGRIDQPFVVTRGDFYRKTGPAAPIRLLALNETKLQIYEGLNGGGAGAAVVMRLVSGAAQNRYVSVALDTAEPPPPPPPPAPTDPYFANVTLLMHMEGVDGGTSFVDETGKTFDASGSVEISTSESVFGGASANFFGSGGMLLCGTANTEFALNQEDFTIEFRVYKTRNGVPETMVAIGPNGESGFGIGSIGTGSASKIKMALAGSGYVVLEDPDDTPLLEWVAVAVTRASGVFRLFVNGVLKDTRTELRAFNSGPCVIGTWVDYVNFRLLGYIDELRITKGVARYTADFTPPTEPFPDAGPTP